MAHALQNYDGPCRHIHGHSYMLEVTVSGEPIIDRSSSKLGMVIDFSDLKAIVKEAVIEKFDHSLVIQKGYDEILLNQNQEGLKVVITLFQPTSENLLTHFVQEIGNRLPVGVRLERMMLRETATSYAEWLRTDQ